MATASNISASDYLTHTGQWQGPIDPSKILQSAGNLAAQTRQVSGSPGQSVYPAFKGVKKTGGKAERGAARGIMQDAAAQHEALGRAAAKEGEAVKVKGAQVANLQQRLSEIQLNQSTVYQSAQAAYDASGDKADEYVQGANARLGEHLAHLDSINEKIWRERDFSQAHAMQAGAQAVLQSMKEEERGIIQQYGADSKEFEQFTQGKKVALASMQSNIFNNYQQLAEQQHQTFLMATNEAYWKQSMYISFQEQQHVEMLKYIAGAKNQYAMQQAQFDIGIAQLEAANMGDWAQYISDAPTFSFDGTPYIGMLMSISNMGDPSVLMQLATAAVGGIAGGLTGGIAGGIGGALSSYLNKDSGNKNQVMRAGQQAASNSIREPLPGVRESRDTKPYRSH